MHAGPLALVWAMAILTGPVPARAGCAGHDVSWNSDLGATIALLNASMFDPAERSDLPPRSPSGQAPCRGPSCSGTPIPLPASGVGRSVAPIERWASPEAVARPTTGDDSPLPVAEAPTRPLVVALALFRPPRRRAGA